jgi:hypothetical protein
MLLNYPFFVQYVGQADDKLIIKFRRIPIWLV